MFKLRRFLKPFAVGLFLAIALLFIQAICELNLPNLMSDIVNVGIQQGGVEDSSPKALSKDAYNFVKTFMADDDKELMDENFTPVSGDEKGPDGKPYSELYSKTADEQIYVLREGVSPEDKTQLDAVFGSTTWSILNAFRDIQERQNDGTLEGLITDQIEAQTIDIIAGRITGSGVKLPEGMTAKEAAEELIKIAPTLQDNSYAPSTPKDLQLLTLLQQVDMPTEDEISQELGLEKLGNLNDLSNSEGFGGLNNSEGSADLQDIDFEQIYQIQPLLNLLPSSIFENARAQAQAVDPGMREQSGRMLIAGLYRELGANMATIEMNYITRIGLIMLLITLISGGATILVSFISNRIAAGVARDLRSSIFSKVASFSHTEFDRFSTASLITRSTNDVTQIQMVLQFGIRMICYAPIMGIGGTIMALEKSVSMSWIIGVAVVVIIGIVLTMMAVVLPRFRIMQTLIDRVNLVARETLNGLMVIRAFGRNNFEQQRFDEANQKLTSNTLFVGRAMTLLMPVMMLFMNGLMILIIWVGSHQVAESQMQVGDMMAYMQYVMQIIMSFMFIAMIFVFIPRAQVSAQRIGEVLETVPVISDPAAPKPLDPTQKGTVEFRNVSFRYKGAEEDALTNISFVARPGRTTAFIGSTGSGKSTIINLIPRFYDVTAGAVLVNGVDVREVSQQELRSRIGYVPQKSVLLGGSVASNIAYGDPDLPPDDIKKIAQVAQAIDFIEEKPEGYDFEIAQGGSNVSGGQRQRLSIARALAVSPDIFLFDDSFSALDFKTDATLRRALAQHTQNATLIIVAQRVSTIMDASQIYVIDDGRVVGHGTHQELLKSCRAYYEIASSQLNEQELGGSEQTGTALQVDTSRQTSNIEGGDR